MKTIVIFIAAALLFLCGCQTPASPEQEAQIRLSKQTKQIVSLLPPGHNNLQYLGNQWFTYEIEVDGTKRKFMARYWRGSHDEIGISVTELR